MIDIQELLAKLPNNSFSELTSEEQQAAAAIMRPAPGEAFVAAQAYLMANFYFVVPSSRLAELDQLNQGQINQAQVVDLADGTKILPSALLTDIQPGETFAHLGEFLTSLKFRKMSASDWSVQESVVL